MPACDWNKTVECSGRLTRSFSWPLASLIGPLRIDNVCRNIEYQARVQAQFLGVSPYFWSRIRLLLSLKRPPLPWNYNEFSGRLGRYNHVCWCKTPAWCGQHWSVRSKSPQTWTTLDKDGGARCRRNEGAFNLIFFKDRLRSTSRKAMPWWERYSLG